MFTNQQTTVVAMTSLGDNWCTSLHSANITETSTSVTYGNFFFGILGNPAFVFENTGIPRGSNIESAIITISDSLSAAASPDPDPDITIVGLNRDPSRRRSVWADSRQQWNPSHFGSFHIIVKDSDLSTVFSLPAGSTAVTPINLRTAPNNSRGFIRREKAASKFTLSSSTDMGNILFVVDERVGTLPSPSTARINIYGVDSSQDVDIPDDDNFLGQGSLIDLTLLGTGVSFPLSNYTDITLAAGDYFAVFEVVEGYPVSFINYLRFRHRRKLDEAFTAMAVFGGGDLLSNVNYIGYRDLYDLMFTDPIAGNVTQTEPFPGVDLAEVYDIPCETVIQAVVNDEFYTRDSHIGIGFRATAEDTKRGALTFDFDSELAPTLTVVWTPRRIGVDTT